MINLEKLKIFEKYKANYDAYYRGSSEAEQKKLTDEDFSVIDLLAHKIYLVEANLTSAQYTEQILKEVDQKVKGEEAKKLLTMISKEDWWYT